MKKIGEEQRERGQIVEDADAYKKQIDALAMHEKLLRR